MTQDSTDSYFGELYVTTTFMVDNPKYIGRHIRNLKIGNVVLLAIGLIAIGGTLYLKWEIVLTRIIISGIVVWGYLNTVTIRDFGKDLDSEPLEIIGVVKKRKYTTYPCCEIELDGVREKFKTDAGFIRRTKIGDKVRLLYTPTLKLVKAWQTVQ